MLWICNQSLSVNLSPRYKANDVASRWPFTSIYAYTADPPKEPAMLIVADENIPLLDAFFEGFGEIRRVPGRAIDRAMVEQADVLLVRSVTNVNRALLEGSKVRFVGTCTICLLYTSPSPRDLSTSRMPSSA